MTSGNSKTAHWIAAVRARETARQDCLFKDPYAKVFAGDIGLNAMLKSEEKSGGENQFIVIRTKYFDDFIKQESEKIQQIVLLGAGFDTRAFRLEMKSNKVVVFEVDKAEILQEKEQKLQSLNHDLHCTGSTRISVAADLRDDWVSCLVAKGFDVTRKTIWVAEGLFFYLTDNVVLSLMQKVDKLSAYGSKLIFDISGSGLLSVPAMSSYIQYLKDKGLPLPFCTDYPETIFNQVGWNDVYLDYVGSKTASYGRVKTLEQEISRATRHPMTSYFVIGTKGK